MGSPFEAPTVGIGRLLKEGGRFLVPHHQRDYSWREDEIEQLLDDIKEARASGQAQYFIGLMVFMHKGTEDYFTILDGQQRMATAMIILASIRTWLRARDRERDADKIQEDFIAGRELGEQDLEPHLVLNENNNQAFCEFVVREAPTEEVQAALKRLKKHDPNRRLLEAILVCRRRVEQIANRKENTLNEATQNLYDFVKYLRDNIKIVRLTVPNEANAYTVFETLNWRGLDLSILDLVKNYLFGKVDSESEAQLREVQTRWAQMMANLINVQADVFLKAYWTSRYGRIQKPQLFPRFKDKVMSSDKAVAISADMLTASEQYAALEVADDPIWVGLSERSRGRIRALKLLGARQVHPVLLSALERFRKRELERLLHLLEVLIVRYQLIGGLRTGRLEISCAALAAGIYREKIGTATEAFQALRDIFPKGAEFREAFREKQERNNQKVRYILQTLESQARRSQGQEMRANENEPSVSLTVEHILPRSPGKAWEPVLQQDPTLAEDCTYRLGNLCLLTGVNKKLGARSFAEKQPTFAQSTLILTQEVPAFADWNRESIEKRQERMAKLAVAAWRFQ